MSADNELAYRYLRLGLQLGRHVEGVVDAYFGPRELAAAVKAVPPVAPSLLLGDAERLLDGLDDGWLRDQVLGLRTYAAVLAGEPMSYADEVEGCYGVRPSHTDEAVFAAAHERLEELLPGDGPLAERHEHWERSIRVPPEQIEATISKVVDEARAWTRGLVDLPDGERVDVEIVHDKPWLGFCEYLGGFRSRIDVNVDLPLSAIELLTIAIHETYPGHHTERCVKEQTLVRGRGLLEETIVMVPTPQSLVAEGIAGLAPILLLEGDGGAALATVVRAAGVDFDLAHALSVELAREPCRRANVNAALMLYEDGVSEDEVRGYVRQWGLVTPEVADHVLRFLEEPTSRSYIYTYTAGRELCRSFVAGEPRRFRELLTEQVRVRDLLAAAAMSSENAGGR